MARDLVCGISALGLATALLMCAGGAHAQAPTTDTSSAGAGRSDTQSSSGEISEIIVTAQKREQSLNSVGITIVAATGDALQERGIASVADLPRLVPGFTVQESAFNSTSFTLRGVGFFNSDLSTPPTVSVYVDEAPLPYPAMTRLVGFDLERVEVLKGPQGTLFGQNATGGAVNYIAAKPGDTFEAGLDVGFGRFDTFEIGGFVSGPLSDTLDARLAFKSTRGDDWQESVSRPGDTLGATEQYQGRAIIDWRPTDRWRSTLTGSVWVDKSDTLAPQFVEASPLIPALANPDLFTQVPAEGQREADWNADLDLGQDSRMIAVSWRNEYDVGDDVMLTSLTNFAHLKTSYVQDFDGTPLSFYHVVSEDGEIRSWSQELRLSGETSRLNWMIGGNYSRDRISENPLQTFGLSSAAQAFGFLGIRLGGSQVRSTTKVETYGIFGNLEYQLTDTLSLQASARYNNDKRDYSGCNYTLDHPLDLGGGVATAYDIIQDTADGSPPDGLVNGVPIVPQVLGQCFLLDPQANFAPLGNRTVDLTIDQDNFSWKGGINWEPRPGMLVYASISKGYKAGTIPVLGASVIEQYNPISQESVLAYEIGLKAGLLDRQLQVNLATFYYDYEDKQLRGKFQDMIFGPIEGLVTIPKSRVYGFEAQAILTPIAGLTIDSSVTYSNTKVREFVGFDGVGNFGDQSGTPFPFAPEWQSVTDVSYNFPISSADEAYLGGTLTYNSRTYSGVGAPEMLYIPEYTLLDLRAGIRLGDGKYDISVWGRNVTNEHYWSNAFLGFDTVARFPARPTSYGIRVSYRH